MRIVDRQSFINHVNGDLLIRDSFGKCIIGDGIELEEAVKDVKNGKEIGFTVQGELVSTMKNFQEKLIKENKK